MYLNAIGKNGYEQIVVASGEQGLQFRDDLHLPFFVNAYFREWLPILDRPGCFVRVSCDSDKPQLYLKVVADYWHTSPEPLSEEIVQAFDVIEYCDEHDVDGLFVVGKTAFIGEPCQYSKQLDNIHINPQPVLDYVDYYRAWKTDYELENLRAANRIAVRGHLAAKQAFHEGRSEYDIHMTYLLAICCQDHELPYSSIVALNENAAVLHHMTLSHKPAAPSLSFLIDAGAQHRGYAF